MSLCSIRQCPVDIESVLTTGVPGTIHEESNCQILLMGRGELGDFQKQIAGSEQTYNLIIRTYHHLDHVLLNSMMQ